MTTKEEYAERREHWLKALESGKYEQGRHALRAEDAKGVTKFCCLGVACDVFEADLDLKVVPEPPSTIFRMYRYNNKGCFLPSKVATHLGLSKKHQSNLTALNDFARYTFADIAKEMRVHPQKYFKRGTF